MNFASIEFLLFFAAFLPVFLVLRSDFRLFFLLAGSWFFYAWWKPPFLILLILTTAIDFWAGHGLANLRSKASRRMLLTASVGMNLSVLFFFKYSFFTENVFNSLSHLTGIPARLPVLQVILPLGISFYTFHSISYMVDVYVGRILPEKNSCVMPSTCVSSPCWSPVRLSAPTICFLNLSAPARLWTRNGFSGG